MPSDHREQAIEQWIADRLAAAPPLTSEQKALIRAALMPYMSGTKRPAPVTAPRATRPCQGQAIDT